jgi:hypothetical protein
MINKVSNPTKATTIPAISNLRSSDIIPCSDCAVLVARERVERVERLLLDFELVGVPLRVDFLGFEADLLLPDLLLVDLRAIIWQKL